MVYMDMKRKSGGERISRRLGRKSEREREGEREGCKETVPSELYIHL